MPLQIIRNDITKTACDIIVNPSNERLEPGGSLDARIHAAAGEQLYAACKKLGGCPIGEARLTKAYNLPSKYVIHTAGPIWLGGKDSEEEKLRSCYRECLKLAKKHRAKSIAFPLISSGTYSFPKDRVLKIAIEEISSFLFENEMLVYIVVYDKAAYSISEKLFSDVKSFIDDKYVENNPPLIPFSFPMCSNRGEMLSSCERSKKQENISEQKSFALGNTSPSANREASTYRFEKSKKKSLEERLSMLDAGFAETLFRLIDEKGMTDVECYKKANVDKKTFSKIKCNRDYRPSKVTVISFAIALKLNIRETEQLLRTVGFSLSRSNKFDVIIEYFITNEKYDIFEINETLFEFDQALLGA